MVKIEAKQYLLTKYTEDSENVNLNYGTPDANFTYATKEYDTEDPNLLKDDELFIETIYVSNDPAQKGWYADVDSYLPKSPLNVPAPSRGIARVLKSKSKDFEKGDYIDAGVGWATHNIIPVSPFVIKVDPSLVSPISHAISVYGLTTITAYLTAFKYSGATTEEEGKVYLITGAAGAVGSVLVHLVDRLFKPKKIIAIVGGKEKVKFVESLGSDKIIGVDYKSSDYDKDFEKALDGDEIDYFYDQVGGEILNKAFAYLANFAHVVQVGATSQYNTGSDFIFNNYNLTIIKRITIRGMVIVDDVPDFPKIIEYLTNQIKEGNLEISNFKETIVPAYGDDFKKVPEIWTGLFEGKNYGKYLTKLVDIDV